MTSFNTIKGKFEIKVFQGGNLIEHYTDQNLVVTQGKKNLARLLAEYEADKNLNRISFGTSGTLPTLADTAITGAYNKNFAGVTYPNDSSATFSFTLELAENNGVTIQEYGLLAVDGTLFARKTRSPIAKTSDIRLEGSWTIIF